MKSQFIDELEDGSRVNSSFAVKYKKPPTKYKKGKKGSWFEIRCSDKTGEITARYWGRDVHLTKELYDSFNKDDVVYVRGKAESYGERLQISIDEESGGIRKLSPSEYSLEDFVKKSERDIDEMFDQLKEIIGGMNHPFKDLLFKFFDDDSFANKFKVAPAAMHRHQNHIGGLLEHSLNVAKICDRIWEVHPNLDRDLLLTGAILHDIGKIKEFKVTTSIDVSTRGMLEGHIILGVEMLKEKIGEINDFPDNLKLKLSHIILSHHGKKEYGSPKEPQFPEAIAIYYADEMDAKVDYSLRLKKEAKTEDEWIWKKDFGHIYLK
jgi:3'-5' exoribonuclease